MKKVTRKDVAEKAQVTETIVSYVINDNRYVDKEKKERVLAAVKELGYRPSPMARALKGKGSNHYLFIADDMMSEHFAIIINEMENLVKNKGICISLCSDRSDTSLLNWQFDGIIIASAVMSEERINQYIATGIPIVVLGMKKYTTLKGEFGLINSGLEEGTYQAVKLLINKGRKNILYIPSLSTKDYVLDEKDYRYLGYKKAIEENNLELSLLHPGSSDKELQEALIKEWEAKPFDAIFARTDSIAAMAMKALTLNDIKIPQEVSIIGVNNTSISRYLNPSLSTINIKRDEIASWILKLLIQLNDKTDKKENLKVLLTTELIERNTI